MNLKKKYKKSLDEKWCMRFKTIHPEQDSYDGIVTHLKGDFIAIREEASFELGGLQIFPKASIKKIRDGKYDKCCNEIIRFTGAIKKLRSPRWLASCETIPEIIEYMMDNDIWPGIEALSKGDKESAFYIGPITETGNTGFKIRCYDATGKWEKRYYLNYRSVFRIETDSAYCKHFNTFMRAKK